MNRSVLLLFIFFHAAPLVPAQLPERSATTAVLRDLGLGDLGHLADRLREVNAGWSVAAPDDDRTRYFSLIYLSYYGRAGEGLADTRAFLEQQAAGGFIPAAPGSRRPVSPFLAQMVLLSAKQRNDFTWLQEAPAGSEISYYDRLRHYLDYWLTGRDADGNGLPAGNGDDLFFPPSHDTVTNVESVALACYLYRECKAMIGLAHQLHRPGDKEAYQRRARALADRLNASLWDEADGFYYDRDEGSGKLSGIKSIAGLLPLFAGMVPYDRAGRLVDEHLRNPAEFGTSFPLPRCAPSGDQATDDACNTVWIPANYMVFQGLMDYGYRDLAKALAHRTFALVFPTGPPLWTYYDVATGRGMGPPATGGWAALAFLMPWEYELNYTPSTWSWQPLIRLAPEYLQVEWREE